jgi:nucleotide-binding universal stress UspA family protein
MTAATATNTVRIVVGVDLSETGDNALREAMRLARTLGQTELHVANVIRTERSLHDAARLAEISTELRGRVDELRGHVQSVCAPPSQGEPFTQETVFHVRLGEPAEALHQVAVDVDADLIVVGTHGRSGVEKLILGSVAEALVRNARVPVVIAHPKSLAELKRSDRVEPPRPGVPVHGTGLMTDRLHLEFLPRTSHISGLI